MSEMTKQHEALNHHGNFIIETCQPSVVETIQEQLNLLNTKWDAVVAKAKASEK